MNRPFARASVASARSAPARRSPSPANAAVPRSRLTTNTAGDAPGPARPAQECHRDRDQQDGLGDLDDEDGAHLGREQAAPGQRRSAEALEDAVVALIRGRDPEVDEAGRDDRKSESAREEEVDRAFRTRLEDPGGREEEQHDDRDHDRHQDVLAAAGGQPELDRRLSRGRGGERRRSAHQVVPSAAVPSRPAATRSR